MKILISGGGIGGLTTALCCLRRGHAARVFEAAPEIGAVGAGIQMPPNAMKVFQAIGIADRIMARAFSPTAIEGRAGRSGTRLFAIPLAQEAKRKWGAPYLAIHRADCMEVLRTALLEQDPDSLKLGATVQDCGQDENSATITLEDGRRSEGDILIGADGIRSPIGALALGAEKPVFSGHMAWRAVVPLEKLGDDAPGKASCLWIGRGSHCVTYRLNRGAGAGEAMVNFVGVVEREDRRMERGGARGGREEALRDFDGWHPVITRIIQEASALFSEALLERPPLRSWRRGRIALLGDAAHPMLPFMAQGAAMAVEDAWAIAAALSAEKGSAKNAPRALKDYERMRRRRARAVQAASKANAETFHPRSLIGEITNHGALWLADKIAPNALRDRVDWLYGYDITRPPPSAPALSDR